MSNIKSIKLQKWIENGSKVSTLASSPDMESIIVDLFNDNNMPFHDKSEAGKLYLESIARFLKNEVEYSIHLTPYKYVLWIHEGKLHILPYQGNKKGKWKYGY